MRSPTFPITSARSSGGDRTAPAREQCFRPRNTSRHASQPCRLNFTPRLLVPDAGTARWSRCRPMPASSSTNAPAAALCCVRSRATAACSARSARFPVRQSKRNDAVVAADPHPFRSMIGEPASIARKSLNKSIIFKIWCKITNRTSAMQPLQEIEAERGLLTVIVFREPRIAVRRFPRSTPVRHSALHPLHLSAHPLRCYGSYRRRRGGAAGVVGLPAACRRIVWRRFRRGRHARGLQRRRRRTLVGGGGRLRRHRAHSLQPR